MLESHRSPVPARRSPEYSLANASHSFGAHLPAGPDDTGVLSGLTESVHAGQHRLDPILAAISDAALHLTGAGGAAIAMWKDGVMVCRARSGVIAPALGAEVSTQSGISGECLSTGTFLYCSDTQNDDRVDAEVCRQLGLRSIAAAPIVGWHGINGILEVFSTEARAFTEEHIALLKQLAGLAEKARALRPQAASPLSKDSEKPATQALAPASDRLRDVVFAAIGSRRRRLVIAVAGLAGTLLLGSAIWLGLRTPDGADAKTQPTPAPVAQAKADTATSRDAIVKSEPGRAAFLSDKPPAGTPVRLASKTERIAEPKESEVVTIKAPASSSIADAVVVDRHAVQKPTESADTPSDPPTIAFESRPATIRGVLTAPIPEPTLALPVSQGVSNGQLLRRVSPRYPPQALQLRLQGTVRVDAIISERGEVEDLKLVEGPPVLARAALEAIRQWRYKPYELNGKPVKIATTITVNFRLP